jgi:Ca2+-binding EF-hand superfamily protein
MAYACRNSDQSELSDWHKQVARSDGTIMTFDEFVRDVTKPSLASNEAQDLGKGRSSRHGLYANHLKEWFRLFNRNQILVLSYDELRTAPEKVQNRIQLFLERTISGKLQKKINSNDSQEKILTPSTEARQCIESIMKPHNELLYQLLEENPGPSMEQRPFPRFHC